MWPAIFFPILRFFWVRARLNSNFTCHSFCLWALGLLINVAYQAESRTVNNFWTYSLISLKHMTFFGTPVLTRSTPNHASLKYIWVSILMQVTELGLLTYLIWHEPFIGGDEIANLECMLDIKAGDVACAELAPAAKCNRSRNSSLQM